MSLISTSGKVIKQTSLEQWMLQQGFCLGLELCYLRNAGESWVLCLMVADNS